MSETKTFHLGDILTITLDRLVSHDHIGGVYNILGWMTGDSLFTHQLPRAAEACKPYLIQTFPKLAEITFPEDIEMSEEAIFRWLDRKAEQYGEWHEVPKLPEGSSYEQIDPLIEAAHIFGADRVIPVVIER